MVGKPSLPFNVRKIFVFKNCETLEPVTQVPLRLRRLSTVICMALKYKDNTRSDKDC